MSKKSDVETWLIRYKNEVRNKKFSEKLELTSLYANEIVKIFSDNKDDECDATEADIY